MATYKGKISGIGNASTGENAITADDLATLRNFIFGWEYGVLNIDGYNFNAQVADDNTSVIIGKGIMFAYGYFGYLSKSITMPFIKSATTQYRFIYGELNKSVTPNTFKIKVKNNQGSSKILETTFRQDYLSEIKTGIFQLPLWCIELNSAGIVEIDDVRELRNFIKQVKNSNRTLRAVTGNIDKSVICQTQPIGDNTRKVASTLFVDRGIKVEIQG